MQKTDRKYLSIGEMARINHTTIAALRLYDKCGILKPAFTDKSSRYRYYDVRQNARLDMIQYMKELGMGLKEIGEVFRKEDLNTIETILIRKQRQTLLGIEQMKIKRDAISRTISSIERYRKSPSPGTVALEYIEKRKIYSMHAGINFYEHDIDTYELILKELKDDLLSHNLPQIYYCNAGTFLKKDDFLSQNFRSDKIFVFVDEHFPSPEKTEIIESGMYACMYADDFETERQSALKLLTFCRHNGYTVTGDYICEVLTEFNVFDCSRRSMFLRLQVPVAFPYDSSFHPVPEDSEK